jgi:uncharacterized protein (TIGR02145 family)
LRAVGTTDPGTGGSGSFTDGRDGKTYRTVTIGTQTWMAENLNYQTADSSWCYGNDNSNCATYGRLYTWNRAKSACPVGWHLPSRQEWNSLVTAVGDSAGTKLKAVSPDWTGTDDFGFSALPGGYRIYVEAFYTLGAYGYWWAATENDASFADGRGMYSGTSVVAEYNVDKSNGYSVRCVQDGTTNPGTTVPAAPTGVTATAASSSSIAVSWSAVSGATGYYIYRSTTSAGTYTQVGSSASASYTDTGLSASTRRYYKVAAYNAGGTGTQSSAVSATTLSSGTTDPGTGGGGSFTDSRDGKTYRTVTIGDQTWMAENLNYQTDSSWCYGNNASNGATSGRLYKWAAAMGLDNSYDSSSASGQIQTPHRGVCPVGWHLPSRQEWNSLVTAVGDSAGTKLKAVSPNWNGTNDFGFSALPGGSRDDDGTFYDLGAYGVWWTATENGSSSAY